VELELAGVALKCSHFDDAGLLEEVEAQDIVLNIGRVLDLSRERMNDVD